MTIYPLTPPLTELLMLSIVSRGDSYGYQISQCLKPVSSIKDSALYPVLKRLSEQGYIEAYDKIFQGRNRKYYRMTETGRIYHKMLSDEWHLHQKAVQDIMQGADHSQAMPDTLQKTDHSETMPGSLKNTDRSEAMPGTLQKTDRSETMPGSLKNTDRSEAMLGSLKKTDRSEAMPNTMERAGD